MAKPPVGSMGPFLEGYREAEQKQPSEKMARTPQATDVLELFSEKRTDRMTMIEIAAQLILPPQEAKTLVDELASKKLVSTESTKDGNDLVALTQRGRLYVQEA